MLKETNVVLTKDEEKALLESALLDFFKKNSLKDYSQLVYDLLEYSKTREISPFRVFESVMQLRDKELEEKNGSRL